MTAKRENSNREQLYVKGHCRCVGEDKLSKLYEESPSCFLQSQSVRDDKLRISVVAQLVE
jgi:hypothetical protein